ncbi:hypothetical protein SARC_03736 [Sphaeroforma arctica JP610]|uniref:Anticodon-binding domain-containing protein n=1 Tax=Sphaeroforma arctica JP610 TaxID=667725 RepID=A0A0L0G4Q9_9EUKA|nr:hypothetical protein SARC_03736 [Sphaeroforma arctica JP610]KNC84025.1 hypothetical protein SARC_03736 [Sphaeroforma arctica JP610]|eukprot:XP_014157927.1 hypothetical protein SARC_03736 [Sphaeroforma arctica JP610]
MGWVKFGTPTYLLARLIHTHCPFSLLSHVSGVATGSQTTVLAGGRYSDLVRELGGTDISGVGWAGGVERLQILIDEVHPNYVQDNGLMRTSEVAVCSLDGAASHVHCLRLTQTLRAAGYRTVFNPSKSHYKQLGAADTAGCQYALLIGKDEVEGSSVCIKDLRTSEQTTIPLHDAVTWIGHQQPLK